MESQATVIFLPEAAENWANPVEPASVRAATIKPRTFFMGNLALLGEKPHRAKQARRRRHFRGGDEEAAGRDRGIAQVIGPSESAGNARRRKSLGTRVGDRAGLVAPPAAETPANPRLRR